MSTDYYLIKTEPTPLYGRVKVAQSSGGNHDRARYGDRPQGAGCEREVPSRG